MKKVFSCEKHPGLAFYAANKKYKFSAGRFITDDKFVISKLETMKDVKLVGDYNPNEEPKSEEDNLVKLIRAVAREEIEAAFGEEEEEEVEEVEVAVEEDELPKEEEEVETAAEEEEEEDPFN